jgi:sulfur-oxidizing protein SoxZ
MARTIINVPQPAKRGEIIEIRTLIAHPMETVFRSGSDGRKLPRDIIRRFACHYNGEPIFSAEFFPAM